jgi:peptidoglycan DL-endopeptidase CwlO
VVISDFRPISLSLPDAFANGAGLRYGPARTATAVRFFMGPEERRKHSRRTGLPLAALLVLSTLVTATGAEARPTHADLTAARAHLNSLNNQQDVLVEQYDQAQVALAKAQQNLDDAKSRVAKADAQAAAAKQELSRRASLAYQGVGSELATIFEASSLSELSDRLEFLNDIAGSDADVVATAQVAGQRAVWARSDLSKAVAERTAILQRIDRSKAQIEQSISQQKSLIDRIQKALQRPVFVPQAPPPQQPTLSHATTTSSPAPVPVVNGSAAAAVAAAYSVIGTPYVYGGSSPETGFDCSGLTMWSWAHAGVSLPHSSAMQYASLPHVDRSDLQPGDLVFFYSPIHHVGMYVGGGMMIHAPHTGAYVEKVPIYWQYFVGAARP